MEQFNKRCVSTIKANPKRCRELLENSTAYATLLSPKLGYDKVSELVKETIRSGKNLRQVVLEQKILNNKEFDEVVRNFKS